MRWAASSLVAAMTAEAADTATGAPRLAKTRARRVQHKR